jgi:hypothetical protein
VAACTSCGKKLNALLAATMPQPICRACFRAGLARPLPLPVEAHSSESSRSDIRLTRLEFCYSRLKIVGFLVIFLFMALLSYWVITHGSSSIEMLIIWGLLGLSAFMLVRMARQLWRGGLGWKARVALVLSEEGIEDPQRLGLIPWGEVLDIWLQKTRNAEGFGPSSQVLCVRVMHPDALLPRLPPRLGGSGVVNRAGRWDADLAIRFATLSPGIGRACSFLHELRGEAVRVVSSG